MEGSSDRAWMTVKVSFTLSPSPQTFYAKIRQPVAVERLSPAFAQVALQPCLGAICKSRPDLLLDLERTDYSIASLDYQETQAVRDTKLAEQARGLFVSPMKANGLDKVWEGKGLLSWALQEATQSPTEATSLVGKVDASGSQLEVCLQFSEVGITHHFVGNAVVLTKLHSSARQPLDLHS